MADEEDLGGGDVSPAKSSGPNWSELSDPLKSFRMIAAFIIVMIYILITAWLIYQLGSVKLAVADDNGVGGSYSKEGWEQITHLLTGLGALVTTAAGVVIGVQVQQVSVASANRRAEMSESEALDAKAKKEKAQSAALSALKQIDALEQDDTIGMAVNTPRPMKAIKEELQSALNP